LDNYNLKLLASPTLFPGKTFISVAMRRIEENHMVRENIRKRRQGQYKKIKPVRKRRENRPIEKRKQMLAK